MAQICTETGCLNMEETILISYLNDFIFCPVSIYFHKLYGNLDRTLYQDSYQKEGTNAHKAIDSNTYSTSKNFLQGIEVYSEKYNIIGKIDIFDVKKGILTERKNKISNVYDGFVFQLYAQYYALMEMGFDVKKIRLYSMMDNKIYDVKLPTKDKEMKAEFEKLLDDMRNFDVQGFKQPNIEKCKKCIYEPSCDRSLIC